MIPGAQSLFGIKTQLQFGKLFVTAVLGNQRSQRQSLGLQGGSATQYFTMKADEYEENRHFLLAQYFRNNYNKAMKQLPVVNSTVQILTIEVWVTNRNGATTDTRDIVGLMDLGEGNLMVPWDGSGANTLPIIMQIHFINILSTILIAVILQPVTKYINRIGSCSRYRILKKHLPGNLQPTDYYFNPQIGFISLNQPLQPDEVLGVAFQYTYNGKVYQVGEFSQDVPPDINW